MFTFTSVRLHEFDCTINEVIVHSLIKHFEKNEKYYEKKLFKLFFLENFTERAMLRHTERLKKG